MKVNILILVAILAIIQFQTQALGQNFFLRTPFNRDPKSDLNTVLMNTTYQIVGPTKPVLCGLSGVTAGTCFLVTSPFTDIDRNGNSKSRLVLVTASHVLEEIFGDIACLRFRVKSDAEWKVVEIPISVRKQGRSNWVKHPKCDLAAMDLLGHVDPSFIEQIRENVGKLTVDQIASDNILEQIEAHPGDNLLCLGYPLNVPSNEAGFPVLRGGRLASYPILPTSTYKYFLFDFEVFPGNSGGPVYITESARTTSRGMTVGTTAAVVGILSSAIEMEQPLKMGVVIPGSYILETIGKAITPSSNTSN